MGGFNPLQAGASAKIIYPSVVVQAGGTSFTFPYPRNFPAFLLQRYGKDTLSGAGLQQSMTQFVDVQFDFSVPWIANAMATTWFNFLMSAIRRVPFDFYPDVTQTSYFTLLLMDDAAGLAYKTAGQYELKTVKVRILIAAAAE
jgi:hypothetical protein